MVVKFVPIIVVFFVFSIFSCIWCIHIPNRQRKFKNNPDTYLTTPEIIRRYGYPAETHIIISKDGYLLEYHRIPFGKHKKATVRTYPILFHHGLYSASVDTVISGPEKGLAYRLADEGYDVWLANARGNTYSRKHVSLDPSEEIFWDFTFHEMGIYDMPAAVDYILDKTSAQKLIYIGHSLGASIFFVFTSLCPEYTDKIFIHVSIAPAGAMPRTTSIVKMFVPFTKEIRLLTDLYYQGRILQYDTLMSLFFKDICAINSNLCEQLLMFALFGEDREQFNITLINIFHNHIPAGSSSKNMIHLSQLISSGAFRYYDYGTIGNLKKYKSTTPPLYNISSILVPMKFYYGNNDVMTVPKDVENIYQQVSRPLGLTLISHKKWNHVDFLLANDVNRYFNNPLLTFLDNVTRIPNFIEMSIETALVDRMPKESD